MEKDIEMMSYKENKGNLEYAWAVAFNAVVQIYCLGDTLSKSRRNKAKNIFDDIYEFASDTADYLKNNMKQ